MLTRSRYYVVGEWVVAVEGAVAVAATATYTSITTSVAAAAVELGTRQLATIASSFAPTRLCSWGCQGCQSVFWAPGLCQTIATLQLELPVLRVLDLH